MAALAVAAICCKLCAQAPTVETLPLQSVVLPTYTATSSNPTTAAFYYIWFNGQWGTLLDMVPQLGEYRSYDPDVIAQHMKWFREAGLDEVIIAWEGINSAGGRTIDENVAQVMKAAADQGLKVMFMIDQYPGRTPAKVETDIDYIVQHYSGSPAWFTTTRATPAFSDDLPKPVFFVYYAGDDVSPKPSQWPGICRALHAKYHAVMLVHYNYDPAWTTAGYFDGMFSYGLESVVGCRQLAQSLGKNAWFVPTATPGFNALRSKDWPDITPRNDGATYDSNWEDALDLGVDLPMVSVTSFNEWSETTQIEPCGSGTDSDGFLFQNYEGLGAEGYIAKTADWAPHARAYKFVDYSGAKSVYSQPGLPSADMGLWQISWGSQGASEVTSAGGKPAAINAPGSYLLYYQAAKAFESKTPAGYTIRIDYFDDSSMFRLAVNTAASSTTHVYSPWIYPTGTQTWRTAIFTVPSAVFDGEFGGGADFRFESLPGGRFSIGLTEVTRN
jgi:hypothetical protein